MQVRITAKYIPMLFEFMAKNDVRWYLCGMHVQSSEKGGIILSATDGHRAIMIHDEDGVTDGEYILPISKAIKRFSAKREAGCVELFENAFWVVNDYIGEGRGKIPLPNDYPRQIGDFRLSDSGTVCLGQITERIAHAEPVKAIDGKYPNVANIFKSFKVGSVCKIGFNPSYVGALKCLSLDRHNGVVQFNSKENSNMLFRVMGEDSDNIAIIIMPMRDEYFENVANPLPDFITAIHDPEENGENHSSQ